MTARIDQATKSINQSINTPCLPGRCVWAATCRIAVSAQVHYSYIRLIFYFTASLARSLQISLSLSDTCLYVSRLQLAVSFMKSSYSDLQISVSESTFVSIYPCFICLSLPLYICSFLFYFSLSLTLSFSLPPSTILTLSLSHSQPQQQSWELD